MSDVAFSPEPYEGDFFIWLQQQASALRARGAGRNSIDYDNVAEEIEGLMRHERNRIRSLAARTIEHLVNSNLSTRRGISHTGERRS